MTRPLISSQQNPPRKTPKISYHSGDRHASSSTYLWRWSIMSKTHQRGPTHAELLCIKEGRHAYDVCRDELRAMNDINRRDILSSRSLRAMHRSCESLRYEHDQLVRDFQAEQSGLTPAQLICAATQVLHQPTNAPPNHYLGYRWIDG